MHTDLATTRSPQARSGDFQATRSPQARSGDFGRGGLRGFERSLPMALMRAREAVMARFRPILAEHDLTEQQWRVLRALDDADDVLSVGELAERTLLLGPSLARMLTSLEQRGMVDRQAAPDARRAELRISLLGRHVVADVAPESEAAYAAIERELDPGDLDELHRLLDKIGDTMNGDAA